MTVRQTSVEVLQKIIEEKVFFNSLKSGFAANDIAFANMLVLNSLRHLNGSQQIINSFLNKKIPEKQKILNYVLVCASTEILLMDTPDYAVINEYVGIAKKLTGKFAAGMVNAILRKIAKEKDDLVLQLQKKLFPDSFKKILSADYEKDIVNQCENVVVSLPPLDVFVKNNPDKWAEKLNGTLFANGTVRINSEKIKVDELSGYDDGMWWVQDIAASLPVLLLGDVKGCKVLDLCAAPGGKTAQLLSRGAIVTAVDVDEQRLHKLKENMDRLQFFDNLKTVVADGLDYLKNNDEMYDVIVLDVPCSATGTYRRHPEVLYLKTIEDVKAQLSIQKKMLNAAALKLHKGGKILYCTCSISKAEGEKQIEAFLKDNADFELVAADADMVSRGNGIKLDKKIFNNGVLRTFPYYMKEQGGMDAFFAACLQKKTD